MPPAVLLAFANTWDNDRHHLRALLQESKAVAKVLESWVEAGIVELPPVLANATIDEVIATFRRYRNRITIFHFGGHASSSTLFFEDELGATSEAHATGLASFLGRQRGLVLVFLNGCCTEPQIRRLSEAGVKTIVATTTAIKDPVAAEFATAFYAELAARPLREAFDTAVDQIRAKWGDELRAVTRDVLGSETQVASEWPWILECDAAYADWRIRRSRWQRVRVAAAGMLVLVAVSLLVSADARRTACRIPGLRSVCASTGLGDVPGAREQALWGAAESERSVEALQAYLRAFPGGVYADQAERRLQGCRKERIERLGEEQDRTFPYVVRRSSSLHPTEEAARRDAEQRGNLEANEECRRIAQHAGSLLVAARATRKTSGWTCLVSSDGHACGFDGAIVCRVRDRIASERYHCYDEK